MIFSTWMRINKLVYSEIIIIKVISPFVLTCIISWVEVGIFGSGAGSNFREPEPTRLNFNLNNKKNQRKKLIFKTINKIKKKPLYEKQHF